MPKEPLLPTGEIILDTTEDCRIQIECRFADQRAILHFEIGCGMFHRKMENPYRVRRG